MQKQVGIGIKKQKKTMFKQADTGLNPGVDCGTSLVPAGWFPGIVSNFRKLGGKASITEKIYASSRNQNYIHTIVCHFKIANQVTKA